MITQGCDEQLPPQDGKVDMIIASSLHWLEKLIWSRSKTDPGTQNTVFFFFLSLFHNGKLEETVAGRRADPKARPNLTIERSLCMTKPSTDVPYN